MTGHIDINLFIYERNKTMSERKVVVCCGTSAENMCEGLSCKVEETDKGICICLTSDDPKRVEQIKEKMKSCCGPSDSKSCC